MTEERIDATLDMLREDELPKVDGWLAVFQEWNMTPDEAERWRQRIRARVVTERTSSVEGRAACAAGSAPR